MKRLAQQTQEQDINHLLKVRREKLAELQQNGRDPFQITKFDQTHHSLEVKGLYEAHETELLKDRQEPNVEGMDEEQAKDTIRGLKSAEGFIRTQLAKKVNLRNTPQIFFVLDQSIEYGVRMSKLIDEVTKDMPEEQEDDGTESEN